MKSYSMCRGLTRPLHALASARLDALGFAEFFLLRETPAGIDRREGPCFTRGLTKRQQVEEALFSGVAKGTSPVRADAGYVADVAPEDWGGEASVP